MRTPMVACSRDAHCRVGSAPPMADSVPSTSSDLLRAAGYGICAALFLGAVMLFWFGFQGAVIPIDCAGLSSTECAFEHEARKSMGYLQLVCAFGLLALSVALYVLWRMQKPKGATK